MRSPGLTDFPSGLAAEKEDLERRASAQAAERIKQQAAIAATHQLAAKTHKTDRAIALIVTVPVRVAAKRQRTEQPFGDLPVARTIQAAVESPQSKHEAYPARRGEHLRIGARAAARQCAPDPQRGSDSDGEQRVERQHGCVGDA